MFLADTSAWIWSRRAAYPELRTWFDEQLLEGDIATCDLVRLELLYGTRNGRKHDQRRVELDALASCPIGPTEWARAVEAQGQLAHPRPSRHRAVKIPNLRVAAAVETAAAELFCYGVDFELIQEETGQPMRWLASPGALR